VISAHSLTERVISEEINLLKCINQSKIMDYKEIMVTKEEVDLVTEVAEVEEVVIKTLTTKLRVLLTRLKSARTLSKMETANMEISALSHMEIKI